MGKKKSKVPEIIPDYTQNDVDSAPPPPISAIASLFGDNSAKTDAVSSLFSDKNPFKRKPQNLAETSKSNGGDENSDVSEVKRRKKSKENREKSNLDDPGSIQEEKTKKKLKNVKPDMDYSEEIFKTPNSDFEGGRELGNESSAELRTDETSNFDKGLGNNLIKKRKRDDVEREYEVRRYGDAANEEEQVQSIAVGKKRKKVDDSADTMVSKEGFDDESKLLRTVFVGNLPVKIKKKLLLKEFSKFGEIESVRIRSVPLMDTKKPVKGAIMLNQINESADSVHAYIVFKTEQSAGSSLSHNMAVVGGNHIRVDRACPPRKKLKGDNSSSLYDNKRTIFVGNLPFDVKDEEVYQLFFGINGLESSIEAVRVIRQPRVGVGKGIAYVLFKTKEAANLATRKRLKLRDRDLRISHAREDSTPSKRKASSQNPTTTYASPSKKSTRDWTPSSTPKASMSYQGLRANKSNGNNIQKKYRPTSNNYAQKNEGTPKVRTTKRPSVAARRGEAQSEASRSKYAGAKRKMGSGTPESSRRHKKVKKFR